VTMSRRTVIGGGGIAAALLAGRARAQQPSTIAIGTLFPLTGPNAQIGRDAGHAVATALDIVNVPHPELDLPLAKDAGLPALGGATIRAVAVDHAGDPAKGRAEAERLVEKEGVVGLVGSYQSAVGAAISQAAERLHVPYLAADNSAPSLTRRGLRYIFRPGAHDETFSRAMFDFTDGLRQAGQSVETLALLHEDTIFGTDSANFQRRLAGERGYRVVADIAYRANATSLEAEVRELKAAAADLLLPTSYTADGILLIRTMRELGYRPKGIVAQNAGFSDPALYETVGQDIVGCVTRGSFSLDLAHKRPGVAAVNALFKARSGRDLNDHSARELMATLILADAINRAASTDGSRIRDALAATDLAGEMTIMPWSRVRFDESGQNNDAEGLLLQWTGDGFLTVHPKEVAVAEPSFPMRWA
jgi:branched-chain amino acid transport system substrate-binding protein